MYLSSRTTPGIDAGAGSRAPVRSVSRVVVLLGLTSMFTDISSEMLTAVLPIYLTLGLGLSPAAFGVVDGLYQGVSAVTRLGAGYLADRWRAPKAVAVSGYALSAATKPLLLLARSLTAVSLVVSVDRIGKGIRTAPRDAMIAEHSDPTSLGTSFGVHRTLDSVGAMLGPLVAFFLLARDPQGYDGIFVCSTAFAVIGLAVLVLFVPGRTPTRRARSQRSAAPHSAPAVVHLRDVARLARRSPGFIRLGAVACLLSLFTISDGFLFLSLLRHDDVVATYFPLLAVGASLAYVLLGIPFGRLADRWGRTRVFLLGHLLLLGAYIAVSGVFGGLVTTITALALLGAFYAATDGVLAAAAVPLLPPELRGSGLAMLQTAVAGTNLVSSIGFGLLLTMLPGTWAYVVMALGTLMALSTAWVLWRRPGSPTEASADRAVTP